MKKYSQIEQRSRQLLLLLYYYGRLLGLLSCRLERRQRGSPTSQQHYEDPPILQFVHIQHHSSRWAIIFWRSVLVLIYWASIPRLLYAKFIEATPDSYARFFGLAQSNSIALFAVVSFIIQVRCETRFIEILNRFVRLFARIAARTFHLHRPASMFTMKFLCICILKLTFTLCGFYNESLLKALAELRNTYWNITQSVGTLISIFMWLGTLYILDICCLGFLMIGLMYERMGGHIRTMIDTMQQQIDEARKAKRITRYQCMRLLCDYSDELDDCGQIYDELYDVTRRFHHIFQWQILFYIYYDFMALLLLLHEAIWRYLEMDYLSMVTLAMVGIKMVNLVMLIMCADYAVFSSKLPMFLAWDIVCSDIDQRWDTSVETFFAARMTQNLQIKVLGFFQLNNEFILLILSAIISYLFILIQFGITGGFAESKHLNATILEATAKMNTTTTILTITSKLNEVKIE